MTPLRTLGRMAGAVLGSALLTVPSIGFGYAMIGSAWPTGNVRMQMQLDATAPTSPTLPLTDGATTWNSVVQDAMDDWNTVLNAMPAARCKFTYTSSTSTSTKLGDGVNSIFFATTMYGQSFDSNTLAVTLVDHYDTDGMPMVKTTEADLIVNANLTWNSYRGSIRSSPVDLRRVVLHELGHVLGLDHPDLANPPQAVTAIMNSTVSNLESIQADDRNGVTFLYGTTLANASITTQPANQSSSVSGTAAFTIGIDGTTPTDPSALLGYTWYFKATGASSYEKLFTIKSANLKFGSVQLADAGSYYLQVMTPDKTVNTNTVTLSVSPLTTVTTTTLANLSTRGIAGSGSSTMIAGFVVTGSHNKNVLLRAVGPTLSGFGVAGTLSDPSLTVKDSSAATLATSPTVWDSGTNAATLRSTMQSVGAFALTAGSKDAVILTNLAPGNYTALVSSASSNSGVVLLEAYDVDNLTSSTPDTTSKLTNLSTRGYVGTGGNVMIAGFVVRGPGPHTYLIRVASTTLAKNYGVTGTLPDPILTLFDSGGSTLRVDDDWDSPTTAQPALNAAFQKVGAFAFPYPSTTTDPTTGLSKRDDSAMQPAMLVTLQPGNYTAQVSGNPNEGTTSPTGNALIEIYEMP